MAHSHKTLTFILSLLLLAATLTTAQTETATVSGRLTDPSGAVIQGAVVQLESIERGTIRRVTSNEAGIYSLPAVQPGQYHMTVSKSGFRQVEFVGLVLNVQDHVEKNFQLQVGSIAESVTVADGAPLVNTEDASVSTLVDRKFAEDLPMNGRSFQSLIELAPGVVVTTPSAYDGGQFSVNGQRSISNYWTVDGVSANFGVGATAAPADAAAGTRPATNALGGTNSLVSVDSLQEFRIQTSSYAPEFGRVPGGQISIVTRSGTNKFHGAIFDYLRNDVLDASDWFNGYTNSPPLPKSKEQQNDFGGTLGGPFVKDRAFFFFSYEGLRLRLPETTLTQVPDMAARQSALPSVQPFLNAFPFDPNQPDLGNGIAQFNGSYSNPASSDTYSVRIDDRLTSNVSIFGRYSDSPSEIHARTGGGNSLNTVELIHFHVQTATVGAAWLASARVSDDLRFNYSRNNSFTSFSLDDFGGAKPLQSIPVPNGFSTQNANFIYSVFSLANGAIVDGLSNRNLQRQINVVDNLTWQVGTHQLKFGVDFRRLSPLAQAPAYTQQAIFTDVPSAAQGLSALALVTAQDSPTLLFRNLGLFAQDTWRIVPRLTVTYGVRWDIDFTPSALDGPTPLAVTGFNLNNLSSLGIAPAGTPPYSTTYGNFAPRVGVAYQINDSGKFQSVLRGGFGVFYDLASSQVGNVLGQSYPYSAASGCPDALNPSCPSGNLIFPYSAPVAAAPPITESSLMSGASLYSFDPHLQLPRTFEWNLALQQNLGTSQTLSATYVGAAGRKMLQSTFLTTVSPTFPGGGLFVANTGNSDYDALQLEFNRHLSSGLQALVSYSVAHSIDTGSTASYANPSNTFVPGSQSSNRGPSDMDIRNSLSVALTYQVPTVGSQRSVRKITGGWSLQSIVHAWSAPPVDIFYSSQFILDRSVTRVRPDITPGVPLYLYGSQYPGGRAINFTPNQGGPGCIGPFCMPPVDPATGLAASQGDLGRNALRGFGASQWDFGVQRDFSLRESLKLQLRAELFNILNHPNFGPPSPYLDLPNFGLSTQTLANSLGGGALGFGGFDPLYQIGGPRSAEFALKLLF